MHTPSGSIPSTTSALLPAANPQNQPKPTTPRQEEGQGKKALGPPNESMPHPRMSETNGINKAKRTNLRLIERRLQQGRKQTTRNPSLAPKIAQMRLPIYPIVHTETGKPAPDFPYTMLSLLLLTEAQLDALATFYSQTYCSHLTHRYPATMKWAQPFLDPCESLPDDCRLDAVERLRVKMRMFARFIGMKGAETPTWEYERQVEILGNKIRWSVQEEERAERKVYSGPASLP